MLLVVVVMPCANEPHLVRGGRHAHLVPDAQQQQAALCAADGHLADELIEALAVQLLAHGADARLARLQATDVCRWPRLLPPHCMHPWWLGSITG
jgi:hypothetical protein